LLDEIRHRNFHIANPGKEEGKPVTTEEPVTEDASSSKEPQALSKPIEIEEETEESAEPETIEESAQDETNEESEEK